MKSRKILISILSGLAATLLSLCAVPLDNVLGIKLVWSLVFPVIISMVWEWPYAVLAFASGPILIPFLVDARRGMLNFLIAGFYLAWGIYNVQSRKRVGKNKKEHWYSCYIGQTVFSVIYVIVVGWLFEKMLKLNAVFCPDGIVYISSIYLKVNLLNDILSEYMIMAIIQVLLQLPLIRKIYGQKPLEYGEISYRYFGNTLLFIIAFSVLDAWMDGVYSVFRGVRLSFFKISTGENIKISLIVFCSSFICHYSIINARMREKSRKMLADLNDELERKVVSRTVDLERAYNDLESFSYTVSHELRTPIRELETYIEIIEEDNADKLGIQSREDILAMKKICTDTINLIKQMMDYSKAGYVVMKIQTIDLNELVNSCMDEMKKAHSDRVVDYKIENLPVVNGDRFLLKQVVFNILSNAYKFTAKIQNPQITIWSQQSGSQQKIFFEDNGVGFKSAYADKVFGIFDRLHNENEYEGKGIGLATVKKIMKRHNGDVQIKGEENKGCTITLIFEQKNVDTRGIVYYNIQV